MTQKILLISGKKQSGKDSAANYLSGFLLKKQGVIDRFALDNEGKLLIDVDVEDPQTGQKTKEWGVLDLNRKDYDYVNYASRAVWPIIKPEHFGDILKDVVQVTFGLEREKLWGTDEDKNSPTHIRWSDVGRLIGNDCPNDEFLSHRQLLEVFGTDICRVLDNECWVKALFKNIILQDYPFVVIADCRFPHEIDFARSVGAKVVRLTRNPKCGTHFAETALDNYTNFDATIDNVNMTQEEKGAELVKILQGFGWC